MINGYATLQQYKDYQRITTTDVTDDSFIETAIEAASRWIDRESGTRFYTATETRLYDTPKKNRLLLDAHFTAITSVVNGDGTTLAASGYVTLPANSVPLYGIELKTTTGTAWLETNGNHLQAISVTGTVGYSSIPPKDVYLACLEIAKALYSRRFGENMTTKTVITNAGVVQIPEGVPDMAAMTIANYRRLGFA
jgi:hypothetical protein